MDGLFPNPFRPGAGHSPPHLAGRVAEREEFLKLLKQQPILSNLVLTGLRGVGKTVLLEKLKPLAINNNWLWAGTDLSESACVSEEAIAIRILADLAPLVSHLVVGRTERRLIGFGRSSEKTPVHLNYGFLKSLYDKTAGLVADRLKRVLEVVWSALEATRTHGIILAYDEAQNLTDQAADKQYPLSLLLDVIQSIQKKQVPVFLLLTGLPTLFPKLVEARTFAERMFHIETLQRLGEAESREAILRPIQQRNCPVQFTPEMVSSIIRHSGGYPYFIQFLCREMYDSCLQQLAAGGKHPRVTVEQAIRKLDADFFSGRWSRATERQRELLTVAAHLENSDREFTVQEIVARSRATSVKPFSASHANQILAKLGENGLVFKNRHGRYCFAVPLMGEFIKRQVNDE